MLILSTLMQDSIAQHPPVKQQWAEPHAEASWTETRSAPPCGRGGVSSSLWRLRRSQRFRKVSEVPGAASLFKPELMKSNEGSVGAQTEPLFSFTESESSCCLKELLTSNL